MERTESYRELLVVNQHGVYVPQVFAGWVQAILESKTKEVEFIGLDAIDYYVIQQGPDHEFYWESWENILNNVTILTRGSRWSLEHDEDLWIIEEDTHD